MIRTLEEQFLEACAVPSDINEHLNYLATLAIDGDAQKVIELGTRGGVSTIALLCGLEMTGGHLWSVDVDPAPDLPWGHWTFIRGDDLAPEVFKALPDDVDFVFIDTSHLYGQTLSELNLYRHKVKAGGKILLHDTELARPYGSRILFPVKRAIEEFCQAESLEWTNHKHNNGLGVIEL